MTTKLNPELVKILIKDKILRPENEKILERLMIQADAVPTAEQKESLQFCCKLLDSAVAIDEAIQQTLKRLNNKSIAQYAPSTSKPSNPSPLTISEPTSVSRSAELPEDYESAIGGMTSEVGPLIQQRFIDSTADAVEAQIVPLSNQFGGAIISRVLSTPESLEVINKGVRDKLLEKFKANS